MIEKDINYDILRNQGTGGDDIGEGNNKIVIYPFDRFQIKVKLSANNEFLGITEIGMNKDFLSFQQRISSRGIHEVEQFYADR